ncbi:MAG: hypothetical protein DRN96_04010 [Thermoproteota archaeon]|nr:MAG: hypothetical protein DRN96_04010 [Candidatus Korarchaeota archaeon]
MIVASKGALDMAYPPLILAQTAASLGMDSIFFTFWGLDIVRKDRVDKLKGAAVGSRRWVCLASSGYCQG